MTTLSANLYDGQTSERRSVNVQLSVPGYISVQKLGSVTRYKLDDVEIADRISSQPARVQLPDGSLLEVADSDAFYVALKNISGKSQWLHAMEASWSNAALALVVTGLFAWLAYTWGIPVLARHAANVVPAEIDREIGVEGLALLDKQVFEPSETDPVRQLQLLAEFMSVVQAVGQPGKFSYQLEFRKGGGLGANALAMPAGIIVITDELIELSEDDAELAAVMAHEVGHVRNRHALRSVLQNSVVAGLVITLTGDASSATSLAAGLPVLLAQAGYSREFEYEADLVAKEYLLSAGIPLHRFADILLRMNEGKMSEPDVINLLSTHPHSEDRVQAFR